MKKLICFIFAVMLLSCEQKPFNGYVVCKEYNPIHMSNKNTQNIQTSAYVHVPRAVVHRTTPHIVKSKWYVYVANKDAVKRFQIDSLYFSQIIVGQKITM
ncbi:hypothetical protein [Dysgonomonas sp. ZJ279]|uniref:hypothetical protein n=1 Tax=Dysgonomonas sp. ZJ279 TaxID=2709796 RepID=UPI0013EBB2D6|nr:hypothetical protein [Dysgonomonas sp. ZJ279]